MTTVSHNVTSMVTIKGIAKMKYAERRRISRWLTRVGKAVTKDYTTLDGSLFNDVLITRLHKN
jgi:hypothetical protein